MITSECHMKVTSQRNHCRCGCRDRENAFMLIFGWQFVFLSWQRHLSSHAWKKMGLLRLGASQISIDALTSCNTLSQISLTSCYVYEYSWSSQKPTTYARRQYADDGCRGNHWFRWRLEKSRLSLQTSRIDQQGEKNAENESKSRFDLPWNSSNGRCMKKLYNNKLWHGQKALEISPGRCHGEIDLGIRGLGIEEVFNHCMFWLDYFE